MRLTRRHPDDYHELVTINMQRAAREAGADVNSFLQLFEKYVKQPIRENPSLLTRLGWE
jgi:hypothetical protein